MKPVKVFGIGFHKTGTKSLGQALSILGYDVVGPNFIFDSDLDRNLVNKAVELAAQHDAFQDNPWPIVFKEMDTAFPGSKFILTVREPKSWLKSASSYFGSDYTPMRRYIYGTGRVRGNESTYLQRYLAHYEEVQRYFAGRPSDLLVYDLVGDAGWKPLCDFLGCEAPDVPFPTANAQPYDGSTSASRKRRRGKRWSKLRALLGNLLRFGRAQ